MAAIVVDAGGQPVPAGIVGQIAFRRPDPVILLEYWCNPPPPFAYMPTAFDH